MKSKLILSSLAVAVVAGAALVSTSAVSAYHGSGQPTEGQRAAKTEERKLRMEERLSEAVADGKLTADQKTALDAKLADLNNKRTELRDSDMERDEVRAAMGEVRDELNSWAEQNSIDLQDILPQHQRQGGPGAHNRMGQE